ncbi:protoglobin domain-containing protein [Thermofilum pendens]|uniref:protoglobin domain-containing protein n=1 Tax=Thermofilum pendens TaxID=2269 RepID=UPI000699F02D|nr:protoglobin domain-containing protein [Thermofilum pendens]
MDSVKRSIVEYAESWSQRSRKVVGISEADIELLRSSWSDANALIDGVVEGFLGRVYEDEEVARLIKEGALSLEELREFCKSHLILVFNGNYDRAHGLWLFWVGLRNLSRGVPVRLDMEFLGFALSELLTRFDDRVKVSLVKAFMWTASVFASAYYASAALSFYLATGVRRELSERLIRQAAEELGRSVEEAISSGSGTPG